jgi:hypothetical protein
MDVTLLLQEVIEEIGKWMSHVSMYKLIEYITFKFWGWDFAAMFTTWLAVLCTL